MLFKSIEMFNFGRYAGRHVFKTAVTRERNVILVRASNDRGKTTLFKAIRYALYGEQGMRASSWVNFQAAARGDGEMYVEIRFEHGGREYRLRRSVGFLKTRRGKEIGTRGQPRAELFDEDGAVKQGDSRDEYKDWIDGMLPRDASQFFFFDGEEIQRYIDIQNAHVEDAVKKVLGIKELFNAVEDMWQIKQKIDEEYSEIAKKQSRDKKERAKLEKLDHDIAIITKDIKGREDISKGAAMQQQELKGKLMQYKSIEDAVRERDGAEREIAKIKAETDEVDKMLSSERGSLGIGMLEGLLRGIERSGGTGVAPDECERRIIRDILGRPDGACICGRAVDATARRTLKSKVKGGEPSIPQRLKHFAQRLLIDLQPGKMAAELAQLDERRSGLVRDMDAQKTVVKRCTDKINSGAPPGVMKALEKEYEKAGMDVGKFKSEMQSLEARRHSMEIEKEKLENRIESDVDDEQMFGARRRKDACKAVIDGIDEAIERYYKERKPELENLISKIFVQLTNNPEMYKGIGIDRQFNLKVVRHDGTELPTDKYSPSAGASQIVATSMIGGLNRFATKDAPIVIDTPLGRLDPDHRSSVMVYYSQMGRQIIILYQPSEIEKDDLERIRDNLASEWVIESVPGKPDVSRIVQEASHL